MICSYCKTETQNPTICDFCQADLTAARPKINDFLDQNAAAYTQPELQKLHTLDLMRILTHVRAERTSMYKTMQLVRKAPESAAEAINDYEEIKERGIQAYRALTARKSVIEEILVDRLGYAPQRVDDKLLTALEARISAYQEKRNHNQPKG